jgi:hypothetical protein
MSFRFTQSVLLVAMFGIPACSQVGAPGQNTEASAIGSLRAIVSAELTYAVTCGNNGFAQALEDLNRPAAGSSTAFIGPDLSTGGVVKSGYAITLRAGDGATVQAAAADTCNGSSRDAMTSFFAEAHPVASSGRSFATDQRGDVYVRDDGQIIGPDMSGAKILE